MDEEYNINEKRVTEGVGEPRLSQPPLRYCAVACW